VHLSAAAQAKMMHRSGQSPALIASALGTSVASVDGYLGIKVAAQVAVTPAATAAPEAAPAVKAAPEAAEQPEAPAAPVASPQPSVPTVAAKG
jgi:hypothetical protein